MPDGAFPDTPAWSVRRYRVILGLIGLGVGMIVCGAFGRVSEATAALLIQGGVECALYSGLGFAFAASAERIGGWWAARRGGLT